MVSLIILSFSTFLFSFGPGRPGSGSPPPPGLSFGQMDLIRFPD